MKSPLKARSFGLNTASERLQEFILGVWGWLVGDILGGFCGFGFVVFVFVIVILIFSLWLIWADT